MLRSTFLKTAALTALGFSPNAFASHLKFQEKFDELRSIGRETNNRELSTYDTAFIIAQAYDRIFGTVKVEDYAGDITVLRILFDAANYVGFYSNDEKFSRRIHDYFERIKSSGYMDLHRAAEVYQSYIAAEMFSDAKEFITKNPYISTKPLPKFVVDHSQGPLQEWDITQMQAQVVSISFVIPDGPYLIVTSSHQCHFSTACMSALDRNGWNKKLQGKIKWLTRVNRGFDFREIFNWNRRYPNFQFSISKNPATWSAISHWETPTFYFFRSGQLITKFSGWPKEGNFKLLADGMEKVGLKLE